MLALLADPDGLGIPGATGITIGAVCAVLLGLVVKIVFILLSRLKEDRDAHDAAMAKKDESFAGEREEWRQALTAVVESHERRADARDALSRETVALQRTSNEALVRVLTLLEKKL